LISMFISSIKVISLLFVKYLMTNRNNIPNIMRPKTRSKYENKSCFLLSRKFNESICLKFPIISFIFYYLYIAHTSKECLRPPSQRSIPTPATA